MRTIANLTLNFLLFTAIQSSSSLISEVSAQTYHSAAGSSESYYCAKCGTYHSRPSNGVTLASYSPSSSGHYQSNRPASSYSGGGTQNVLSMLNGQRARMGIGGLQYDPQLQVVAEQRAQKMASMGLKSHPPGSFSPGRYEGVGWSSSFSPSGVSACYTSDTRMRYAGAAMASGRDGVYFAVVYR